MAELSFPTLHHHNSDMTTPYTNLSWEKHQPWYLSGSEEHSYIKKKILNWLELFFNTQDFQIVKEAGLGAKQCWRDSESDTPSGSKLC